MKTEIISSANYLSKYEIAVINTLLYFDIFKYPLKADEISHFSEELFPDESILTNVLIQLKKRKLIFQQGQYFTLSADNGQIKRREEGNKKAQRMLNKAQRYSALIYRFPFVRCVCISGSLSKGYMDDTGDVDYFIITTPKRLWIARTFLIAFKKIILLNSHKYFCVNYFIDTEHLDIPDRNIFTATELLTLMPMAGEQEYRKLMLKNKWATHYLPNHKLVQKPDRVVKAGRLKNWLECLLNHVAADVLDNWLMRITVRRWQRKFRHFSTEELEHAFRSRKYVSKHHPRNFQQRVLKQLDEQRKKFKALNNIDWYD